MYGIRRWLPGIAGAMTSRIGTRAEAQEHLGTILVWQAGRGRIVAETTRDHWQIRDADGNFLESLRIVRFV